MKTLIAVILALGVGFASAYVIISKQKPAPAPQVEPSSVATPQTPAAAPKIVAKPAPAIAAGESPQEVLEDLLNIRMGTTGSARNTALRTVVFKLEYLAHIGNDAVPAIRSFLGRSVDVSYNQEDNRNQNAQPQANANAPNEGNNANNNNNGNNRFNRGGFGGFRGARRARDLQNLETDWVVPPSLRLGLVGTLKEIGGTDAEQALAEMLASTGRGVEVAYLTVVLQDMAPDKYRDEAIKSAKDLLTHPLAVDSPDRLDDLSKSYLYGVLEFYKDTSFVPTAQQMLVGADGRLDQDAMDYISAVMGDQSVSALYSAYNNPALTNQFDKMQLGRDILNFVGQNPQANQLFTENLNNPNADPRTKVFSVIQLAGGGFGGGDLPTDPQVVNARISLLNSIASQFASDPSLSQAIALATQALQSGQGIQRQDMRQIFQAMDNGGGGGFGGGRRGRGGNGGGN